MKAHSIAVIKRSAQDVVMELVVAVLLLLTFLGALAMTAGFDSRDVDTRRIQPNW
jgi:hypothetical protein